MKYFIDTEFIEGFHKPLFGKKRHFIDLISIAIVSEDGREYSAISREYSYSKADSWVRENVITPLYANTVHGDRRNHLDVDSFHKEYGKSLKTIAKEIIEFINPGLGWPVMSYNNSEFKNDSSLDRYFKAHKVGVFRIGDVNGGSYRALDYYYAQPEFYGYYADYDWVLFCSLFGRMINLPKGFPMYCKDLKQMLDDKATWLALNKPTRYAHKDKDDTPEIKLSHLKSCDAYPKQQNEHLAIDDARWNKKLYDFIEAI